MVSRCSLLLSSRELFGAGEKSGCGTAENSVCASDDAFSRDDCALETVCPLRRGMFVRPLALPPKLSCECDLAPNDREPRAIEREPRSDAEGIVDSWELH
jgi:hypothetical protein